MSSQMDKMMAMMEKMMKDNAKLSAKIEALEKRDACSDTSDSRQSLEVDTERLLVNIMKFSNGNDAWDVIKCAYYGNPEAFKIVGTLHTDAEGRAHYSMRWTMNEKQYRNFHIYGVLKFSTFRVSSIKMFVWRDKVIDFGEFNSNTIADSRICDFFERSA